MSSLSEKRCILCCLAQRGWSLGTSIVGEEFHVRPSFKARALTSPLTWTWRNRTARWKRALLVMLLVASKRWIEDADQVEV